MPNPAYAKISINGAEVPGEVISTEQSKDKTVEILEVHHEVMRPTETSGGFSGRRIHHPLRLIKKIDKVTPSLYQAMAQNQTLTIDLHWYKPNENSGKMDHFFTHKIVGGRIDSIKAYMPYVKDPTKERFTELEEVSIRYDSITWTHMLDNIEFTDSGWHDAN